MTALQACEVVPILQILIVIGIIRMLRRIVAVTVFAPTSDPGQALPHSLC
jgi:hypothetical protein